MFFLQTVMEGWVTDMDIYPILKLREQRLSKMKSIVLPLETLVSSAATQWKAIPSSVCMLKYITTNTY